MIRTLARKNSRHKEKSQEKRRRKKITKKTGKKQRRSAGRGKDTKIKEERESTATGKGEVT